VVKRIMVFTVSQDLSRAMALWPSAHKQEPTPRREDGL
jgi:hypothetical protein